MGTTPLRLWKPDVHASGFFCVQISCQTRCWAIPFNLQSSLPVSLSYWLDRSVQQGKKHMEDNTKTWGIRGISADVRQAVITQSQKQGMKAGEWLTVAILEKIRQDRNAGKALVATNGKPAVSAEDASAVLALLERLQGMGIEPPERMKKQATTLVRKCMTSAKRGNVWQKIFGRD